MLSRVRWILAIAGLVFALVGIAAQNAIVIWSAMGILAVALGLGLYLRKQRDRSSE